MNLDSIPTSCSPVKDYISKHWLEIAPIENNLSDYPIGTSEIVDKTVELLGHTLKITNNTTGQIMIFQLQQSDVQKLKGIDFTSYRLFLVPSK